MIDPRLKITWGRFDDHGRFKPLLFQATDCPPPYVVKERQPVLATRTNVYVSPTAIFEAKPGNRSKKSISVPNARQHLSAAIGIEESDFENFCVHGRGL
jgi:hypothetical protein